ncbi:hypothetical protein H5T58_01695 [Candidatus Parcubacteria bacterium]|nr:hypothetical protein [Candidatus Parcubacteria bacterium]
MRKFWLVSVSMGYGHQRTAFPLSRFALRWVQANEYPEIPQRDKIIWKRAKDFYESLSRLKNVKFFGPILFSFLDFFQKIPPFYPKKDWTKPNFMLKQNYSLIKRGWGRDLIERLKRENPFVPFVSTFFTPAFMAEVFNYPGPIFCIVCDADIARTWAPLDPLKSKIKYFVPTERVAERLQLYGVKRENIFFTGFPLPLDNAKGAPENLKMRILNLDPKGKFLKKYKDLVEKKIGKLPKISSRPLTILFSIGGAGAQKEIALEAFRQLQKEIQTQEIRFIVSVGTREDLKRFFEKKIEKKPLGFSLLFGSTIKEYFEKFNNALKTIDILWTKPSELSFYSALGIPILIAPPIGSQEEFNLRWLQNSGYGILQRDVRYFRDWFFDWLNEGYFAEMAFEAFLEGERFGTEKIRKILLQYAI